MSIMWIAIIIIGTIVGMIVGAMILHSICYLDDMAYYWGAFIGGIVLFILCFGAKQCFDEKVFICTDVTIGVESTPFIKEIQEGKTAILGSKMVLEFYDKSVKGTSIFIHKNKEVQESFVLDEVDNGYNESHYGQPEKRPLHTFETGSMRMELNEFMWFVTSFSIIKKDTNNNEATFVYKRKYF